MTPSLSLLVIQIVITSATRVNVDVTLPKKTAFEIFTAEEMLGVEFPNTTSLDIVTVNVVLDDSKLRSLSKRPPSDLFQTTIIHHDADAVIDEERRRLSNRTRWRATSAPDLFFLEYRDWIEYDVFIHALPLRFPEIASLSYIGQTIQGRNIPMITLSSGGAPGEKAGFYIQAAVHAREWLANAATLFIVNALAEGYGSDDRITEILDAVNIFVVPTVNIDGYIYSWEVDRLWRKNRRENGGGAFGVDLNRNYDGPPGTWGTTGVSFNPNSDIYPGEGPFSEPETRAARDFVLDPIHRIMATFDMHTYGRLILWPWGHVAIDLPQEYYERFRDLGNDLMLAVEAVNGQIYVSIPAYDLYPASGTMTDFPFAASGGIDGGQVRSFCFEGRGTNFAPPPSDIIPAGQEQLAGVLQMAEHIMSSEW